MVDDGEPIVSGHNQRIAILLRTQCSHSRDTLRGIVDAVWSSGQPYARSTRANRPNLPWTLKLFSQLEHVGDAALLREIRGFDPHGIIFESFGASMSAQIGKLRRPKIEVFYYGSPAKHTTISTDHAAIAKLAAEYLVELGLRNFAFVGSSNYAFSEMRRQSFAEALHKLPILKRGPSAGAYGLEYFDRSDPNWRRHTASWLQALPRPIGIFAANDLFATEILQELMQHDWRIPEDAALLGVDDDELQCTLAYPPLSSIQPGFRQIGRAAAHALGQLFTVADLPPTAIRIPPLRVVVRQSTDITHISDKHIAAALQFIRANPTRNMTVKELMHRLPTNRRYLERAFVQILGRTLMEEIHRVRIIKIKELLMAGKTIQQISHEMQFSSPKYMTTLFHRLTGTTPSAFQATLTRPLLSNE